MLFNFFLARARILSCFSFLFLVITSNFFIISAVKEKIKAKLAPAIPASAPITLTEEITQTPPLVALKTIKILSM